MNRCHLKDTIKRNINNLMLFVRGELLINKYWTIFGALIHFRLEPKAFRNDVEAIGNLIDDCEREHSPEAEALIKDLLQDATWRWGHDVELMRLETFADETFRVTWQASFGLA